MLTAPLGSNGCDADKRKHHFQQFLCCCGVILCRGYLFVCGRYLVTGLYATIFIVYVHFDQITGILLRKIFWTRTRKDSLRPLNIFQDAFQAAAHLRRTVCVRYKFRADLGKRKSPSSAGNRTPVPQLSSLLTMQTEVSRFKSWFPLETSYTLFNERKVYA
jgi:hypothetical protein